MKPRGFTLIECLIAVALGLFVVCASLEFLNFAQRLFVKLKNNEETAQSVLAAFDKIRIDLHRAGCDLVPALRLGLVEAVETSGNILTICRGAGAHALAEDAEAGEECLVLSSLGDLRPGRRICLWDDSKGEAAEIAAVDTAARTIVLRAPLEGAYRAASATVVLVESTALYLDEGSATLRRRVNRSSAQPLLDDVASADFRYDRERNLALVRLEVKSQGGRAYEISAFPKNSAVAR
jgi:prepilin-type N-terminal cleavage/methylation domain-containing protein